MLVLVSSLLLPGALVQPPAPRLSSHIRSGRAPLASFDPLGLGTPTTPPIDGQGAGAMAAVGVAALLAAQPEAAMAKGGEYGIFEGRIVSLAHPAVMALTYATSAFAGFTGLQWRRLREIGGEITKLKAEQKKLAPAVVDGVAASPSAQYTALGTQIAELTATRKELADGSFRDKHYQAGALVLGLGTSFAIEGPINTFLRAQKLFPGPHLYAGAGIVVCWAMAASMVPQMGKGSDAARNAHMAFNALALGLFTWQLPTGWEIMLKVIKFTKFP